MLNPHSGEESGIYYKKVVIRLDKAVLGHF